MARARAARHARWSRRTGSNLLQASGQSQHELRTFAPAAPSPGPAPPSRPGTSRSPAPATPSDAPEHTAPAPAPCSARFCASPCAQTMPPTPSSAQTCGLPHPRSLEPPAGAVRRVQTPARPGLPLQVCRTASNRMASQSRQVPLPMRQPSATAVRQARAAAART
eukprot:scaffold2619_cov123-Isochrysis_galbana.AAC.7